MRSVMKEHENIWPVPPSVPVQFDGERGAIAENPTCMAPDDGACCIQYHDVKTRLDRLEKAARRALSSNPYNQSQILLVMDDLSAALSATATKKPFPSAAQIMAGFDKAIAAIKAAPMRGAGWRSDCPACVGSKFTCDEHYQNNSPT